MASNLKAVLFRLSDDEFDWLQKKAEGWDITLNNLLRLSIGLPALTRGGWRNRTGSLKALQAWRDHEAQEAKERRKGEPETKKRKRQRRSEAV